MRLTMEWRGPSHSLKGIFRLLAGKEYSRYLQRRCKTTETATTATAAAATIAAATTITVPSPHLCTSRMDLRPFPFDKRTPLGEARTHCTPPPLRRGKGGGRGRGSRRRCTSRRRGSPPRRSRERRGLAYTEIPVVQYRNRKNFA